MKLQAEALLFDNDGTLVSSMESVHRCWTLWAREYGIPAEDFARVELHGRPLAEARLREAGVDFPELVTAGDVTRGKPDPEPFLLAARRLGVDPARCVVFEDAPAGLAAGRAAGMRTVALTTTHPAAELDADVVVRNLSAVSALVSEGGITLETDPAS
ncbi:HAD-IA family hydrolase [Streptomyces sp. C]|uniref:HAD-IA family hydrolase n=1 Tax=Streptomyces sp. C TaxID=253839 RepID=UPI0001B53C1F|nr:HAD-IA family hydrolase [Streptomyces sp. C]